MRIRPYIENLDYKYLKEWIDNETVHALWCANLIPYPMTKESLHSILEKNAEEWTGSAYVATEDNGTLVGFFCYSVCVDDNTGFLNFVIVDHKRRGQGKGQNMVKLSLQYAFHITGVECVQLNVFCENTIAMHCYEKIGFVKRSVEKDVFSYKDELWSRCNMIISKREA